MELIELIKSRRSIRSFTNKPIPKEILEMIVDTGRFAPTARAIEPWEFIIVTKRDRLREIAEHTDHGRFIAQAAACIAVFCRDTKYYLEDGCAAVENTLIAARVLGVASCWVAGDKKHYAHTIATLLHIPDGFKLIALLALGYPESDNTFNIIKKRALHEVLHWEYFT